MNIYVICPVRGANPFDARTVDHAVAALEAEGHHVHYPPRDAEQDDVTGTAICRTHLEAMRAADAVAVFWNVESKGSHFDLGMAWALGKPVFSRCLFGNDTEEKSYWKVIRDWNDD